MCIYNGNKLECQIITSHNHNINDEPHNELKAGTHMDNV